MVNLQAEQRIQTVDLEALQRSLERHLDHSTLRFNGHEERIRTLEDEIIPYNRQNPSFLD